LTAPSWYLQQKLAGMNLMKKIVYAVAGLAAVAMMGSANAGTLEDVKARGVLNCIVSTGTPGFSNPDDSGKWQGFDVDFCRATAAAVLVTPTRSATFPPPVQTVSPC